MSCALWHGDCLDVMATLDAGSVDAIVTDPPYGLSFMGREWDHGIPGVPFWTAALRVAKPGAHLVAFGGTRTYHRLACAIEDAGWEVRDCLMWLYGSGMPKSLDVSKAIDKAAGAEREVLGEHARGRIAYGGYAKGALAQGARPSLCMGDGNVTAPATDAARAWSGWGTALKPAWEPILLARKPLAGTVAANVQRHGTGALNIDGCRVEAKGRPARESRSEASVSVFSDGLNGSRAVGTTDLGRWPANVVLDEAAAAQLGDPSRFFYCPKASRAERGEGNAHPTVKPVALMRWLVRLVTPPGGLVLDPFTGSGTTGVACALESMRFVGIEQVEAYADMAMQRLRAVRKAQREAVK